MSKTDKCSCEKDIVCYCGDCNIKHYRFTEEETERILSVLSYFKAHYSGAAHVQQTMEELQQKIWEATQS